jgi:hypothetical protein
MTFTTIRQRTSTALRQPMSRAVKYDALVLTEVYSAAHFQIQIPIFGETSFIHQSKLVV